MPSSAREGASSARIMTGRKNACGSASLEIVPMRVRTATEYSVSKPKKRFCMILFSQRTHDAASIHEHQTKIHECPHGSMQAKTPHAEFLRILSYFFEIATNQAKVGRKGVSDTKIIPQDVPIHRPGKLEWIGIPLTLLIQVPEKLCPKTCARLLRRHLDGTLNFARFKKFLYHATFLKTGVDPLLANIAIQKIKHTRALIRDR